MNIAIASDHAGLDLKTRIIEYLQDHRHDVVDFGASSHESVDYPDFGIPVAEAVSEGRIERGILICGTGVGMSIVANKFPKIRAALCSDPTTAEVSRKHNNANILVLGQRVIEVEKALDVVNLWLTTDFEGGRHLRRLKKIEKIETQPRVLKKN